MSEVTESTRARCQHCDSVHLVKQGHTASGDQKVRCKACGKYGTIQFAVQAPFEENIEIERQEEEIKMSQENESANTAEQDTTTTTVTTVTTTSSQKASKVEKAVKADKKADKPQSERAKRQNDIYERNLYTVTRMMNESGLDGVALRKFKFAAQRAAGNGELKSEVETLTGRQWRRVFTQEDAHQFMAENIDGWKPQQ